LLAALDRRDQSHNACARLLSETREPRLIPAPVLVELDYFLTREFGPEPMESVLRDVKRGALAIEALVEADYERVAELMSDYSDLRVGLVDAAVLAIVERLREPKLATLDTRHFAVMRPKHVKALTLLPS
jgi:predicted nucleic acid-binding protein